MLVETHTDAIQDYISLLPFPVFAVCLPAITSTRHISDWTAVRIQARAFGDASCNEDVVVCSQVVRL